MEFKYQNLHNAEAILITCIDFRFHQVTTQYVKEKLDIKDFDLLTIPGVAKNFVEENQLSTGAIRIIKEVSLPLHQIKKVILIGHWDCGGYGGSKNFDSEADEEERYQVDLQKAKQILNNEFPELEVIIGYSKIRGDQLDFVMMN